MAEVPPRDVLRKVRKLALLPEEVRRSRWAVSITRLTVLKSLCREPDVANRFVTYLARRTLEHVERGPQRSTGLAAETARAHQRLMADALAEMARWIEDPGEERRQRLWELLRQLEAEQNEYRRIYGGPVRIIHDGDLLVVEYATHCLLDPYGAGGWAYQTARQYAERYDPSHGTGLIPESTPLVQDIADFWIQEFGLDREALTAPAQAKRAADERPASSKKGKRTGGRASKARCTHRQGQFLAFMHLYRKLHRQGPAELDLVQFFRVTPPSVHGMVVKLEELGLVTREPGVARSVRVTIPEEEIPALEDVQGPPW